MTSSKLTRRLSIAPMLDWTDRHCRFFMRLLSSYTLLYTEMVTTGALLYGDAERWLAYHPAEHPIALQLGGSDPSELAEAARMGASHGYDEVNLNLGCPSDRVQSGRFGACLMAEPDLVADCIRAMTSVVDIPVTVKTRIGIDYQDSYEALTHLVETLADAGCDSFIIHARKAWLKGLSPKQNREIPPLRYDVVTRIKQDFPRLEISINGGIKTLDQATKLLQELDGVMIGREAYQNPWLLADADQRIFDREQLEKKTRHGVLEAFIPYVEQELSRGTQLKRITRHLSGLFLGLPGARSWRRHLSEHSHLPGAGPEIIRTAAKFVACPDREVSLQTNYFDQGANQ